MFFFFLSAIVILAFTNLGAASIAYGEKIICFSVSRVAFLEKQKQPSPYLYTLINTGRQYTKILHSLCRIHVINLKNTITFQDWPPEIAIQTRASKIWQQFHYLQYFNWRVCVCLT